MNLKHSEELLKVAPNLYGSVISENAKIGKEPFYPIAFGFECNDGWFDILYKASKELEALILQFPEDQREYFKASQVKEKYGTLRLYLFSGTDEMFKITEKLELESETICEICGKEAVLDSNSGWYSTLCKQHRFEKYGT